MPFSKNLLSIISDNQGIALKDFLGETPESWAARHMALRYSAAPPLEGEGPSHVAVRCYNRLKAEYQTIRAWFTEPDYKLSVLLQSKSLANQFSGVLGDGLGWDWQRDSEPDVRIMQFKGTLIAAQRQFGLMPENRRAEMSPHVSAVCRSIKSAYILRSEVHLWRPVERRKDDAIELVHSGAELADRWAKFQTFVFLIRLGLNEQYCWDVSGCRKSLGLIDEDPTSDLSLRHEVGTAPVKSEDA